MINGDKLVEALSSQATTSQKLTDAALAVVSLWEKAADEHYDYQDALSIIECAVFQLKHQNSFTDIDFQWIKQAVELMKKPKLTDEDVVALRRSFLDHPFKSFVQMVVEGDLERLNPS